MRMFLKLKLCIIFQMMLVDKHTIELTAEKINASSKGGLISEDIFNLVTYIKKTANSLSSN